MLPASAQRLPEAFFIKIGARAKEWKAIHDVILTAVGAAIELIQYKICVGQTKWPPVVCQEPVAAKSA
jgi:hypothetical protein